MNELNRQLQQTFYFSNADLRVNRTGALSPRQQMRQRAAGGSLRLAVGAFVLVMLGSLAMFTFFSTRNMPETTNAQDTLLPILVVGGVVLVVIVIGYFSSRPYIKTSQSRKISLARGKAAFGRINDESAQFPIKIGETTLRLTTVEQLQAFVPGVDYRLFYLPGPVPLILSGEVIGTEAESDLDDPSVEIEPPEKDRVVGMQHAGRLVLIVLVALVFIIPLAGFAASSLPGVLRWLVMAGLLGVGVGFVFWALRKLGG